MTTGDDNSMRSALEAVSNRLDGVDKRFDAVDERFDVVENRLDGLDKKLDDLANSTSMQFEAVRDDIKKLGEGYESGLKAISRQIGELDKKWSDSWSVHSSVLKNHAERISALEQHHANRGHQ